jgi:hypothetical protein
MLETEPQAVQQLLLLQSLSERHNHLVTGGSLC